MTFMRILGGCSGSQFCFGFFEMDVVQQKKDCSKVISYLILYLLRNISSKKITYWLGRGTGTGRVATSKPVGLVFDCMTAFCVVGTRGRLGMVLSIVLPVVKNSEAIPFSLYNSLM